MAIRNVVCICGSGRFWNEILAAAAELTLKGHVVLQPNFNVKETTVVPLPAADKEKLDALHLDKIGMANEVFVVNKDGYIGDSTAAEIRHALRIGKRVTFTDAETGNAWVKANVTTQDGKPVLAADPVAPDSTAAFLKAAQAPSPAASEDPDYRGPCKACGLSLRRGQEHHHGFHVCVGWGPDRDVSAMRVLASSLHHERKQLLLDACVLLDHLEAAWIVIANAHRATWGTTKASVEWNQAAAKWRDRWHEIRGPIMEKTKVMRAERALQARFDKILELAREGSGNRLVGLLLGELEAIKGMLGAVWSEPTA